MIREILFPIIVMAFWFFGLAGNALSGKILYDDFSEGRLVENKWWPRESVREIVDGKLVLKLGNSSGMGAEVSPGLFRNNINILNPESVQAIECEIIIVDATPDSVEGSRGFARISGQFYNINTAGGLAGEIAFEIMIGERGNSGIEAFWEASEYLTDDGSEFNEIANGTLIGPGTLKSGIPYIVRLSYDGDRTITFSVNGISGQYVGPEKKRSAVNPMRNFAACIDAADGSNDGYVYASYDNVKINNTSVTFDDFSTPLIDLSKWSTTEWVREVAGGHLQTVLRRADSSGSADTYFSTKDASYIEATTRIDSETQLSEGASCIARLQGYYYNESRGPGSGNEYNDNEGDVFAQIRIQYFSDGTLNAGAFVDRSDSADGSSWTNLFGHTFNRPISLDTDYILSIGFKNNQLIFKCNDEIVVYNITTPNYTPYGEHRLLRSRLNLDPGESGYLKTQFDNVYVGTSPLIDVITDLKILTGTPWTAEDVIPPDFDHNGKIGLADAVASLQLAAGIIQDIEHSSLKYTIQNYYPENYTIAISGTEPYSLETVEGPNIVNYWQFSEEHWLVGLSTKPSIGDTYNFHYRYPDEIVKDDTYTISTINNNFAFINSPTDGTVVNSETFPITWQPDNGTVDHYSIIVSEDTGVFVWSAVFPSETTSTTFNYNNTATSTLQSGKSYTIYLHSYDQYGNQATTVSTFWFLFVE